MLTLNLVAYERMGLCNPVSAGSVEDVLAQIDVTEGRAAELGCGNAALAIILARYGYQVSAFDRSEEMVALARRRLIAEDFGWVTVEAGDAGAHAEAGAPWSLVSVIGATALGDFARLTSWIEPGGWLLWGDLFWKAEPPASLRKAMGDPDYETHEGWLARGAAAGLITRDIRISNDVEWDAYVSDITNAVAAWAGENPGHPDRSRIERHAAAMQALYGPAGREFIGFGLYLFRKPV